MKYWLKILKCEFGIYARKIKIIGINYDLYILYTISERTGDCELYKEKIYYNIDIVNLVHALRKIN